MKTKLAGVIKGKTVIIGIGNPLRGDDGFGPALVASIDGKVDALCIDAGTAPENYTGKIVKVDPDTLIIVDAVHLEKEVGAVKVLKGEEIESRGFTTHDLSPNMFMEYIKNNTRADIYLLGVQPGNLGFGSDMSDPVKKRLAELGAILKEVKNA